MDAYILNSVLEIIPGFTILKEINKQSPHVFYLAKKDDDNLEVIIKTLEAKYPKKEDILGIQREYRITKQVQGNGIIKFYDLVAYGNGNLAIIMERFGDSLNNYLFNYSDRILPQEQFLKLAAKLVSIVGSVHDKKIIHKKIEPKNVLVDPATFNVRLIDFASSSEISHEFQDDFALPENMGGALSYFSPEQTGRINRNIDYRSDYYSLGVLFYQLLTGQLPFNAKDPVEWVHCTISRQPISPNKINKKININLSEIIDKLLSKNAENRYQSSKGILADLNKCKIQIHAGLYDLKFELAQEDISKIFQIPQKLYGRDSELKNLESLFSHVTFGAVEFCLVAGYSGVGKTSLVRELGKSIVEKNGFLIQGKFEQFRQNAAYVAISSAFGSLIHQLLGESEERLANWKEKIKSILGLNAQLIIDLVPELELIIGKQPPVPELSPQEGQNRFLLLFTNFVNLFAGEGHPLVIFLDDLQWSDVPTLNLLERLVTSNELSHLFIIGAYRDNEVDTTHPLQVTLRQIKNKRIVEILSLKPLSLNATDDLICETLLCNPEKSHELSQIVFDKTGGNPFFTIELLKNLNEREAIYYSSSKARWVWDTKKIKNANYSDNIIEILLANQSRLKPSTQRILQLAACIGTTFDLRTLSFIVKKSIEKTGVDLYDAIRFNMLIPLNPNYKFISPESSFKNEINFDNNQEINPVFKFQHDRIQQAAYSQISPNERKILHLSIGRLISNHTDDKELEERLMEIVGHFNQGRTLINSTKEGRKLAALNLAAGIKAKISSAYESALNFLLIGREMLGGKAWLNDYKTTWEIHYELQQCYYLTADWKNADNLSNVLLQNSQTTTEKGLVLSVRTRQYATTQRMKKSIQAAFEGLQILGFRFKNNPTKNDVEHEVSLIQKNLGERSVSSLINLPEMTDKKAKIASQLIMEAFPAAFLSASGEMFPYLVLKSVNIALDYGNSLESAFAYAAYGMILCGFFDDTALGYEYGKLGVDISEKFDDVSLKARIIYVYTMFVHHWSNHWSSMTPWFRKGIEAGYQSGDLLYLAYSAQDCIIWDPRLNLDKASNEHRKLLEIVKKCDYQDSYDSGTLFLQMQLNFQGLTKSKYSLTDNKFNESRCLEGMQQRHFMTGISNYFIYKAEIHLLYNDGLGALEFIQKQEKSMASVMALPQNTRFQIISFLTYSMLLITKNEEEQSVFLQKMHNNYTKISNWEKQCPENFEHLRLLMEAEFAQNKGDIQKALILYEKSIACSRQNGFIRDEAMTNERAAKLLLNLQLERAAEGYLNEAYYLYYQWGAYRKVEEMKNEYLHILTFDNITVKKDLNSNLSLSQTVPAKNTNPSKMDFVSVLKASQTISEELVLEKLLKATLDVIIENAGAQKGFLIDKREGQIIIQAEVTIDDDEQTKRYPLLTYSRNVPVLPFSLVNTALRTNETVIIDNASEINTYSTDPYIKSKKPLSVICVPLPLHGKWPAAVYLENNITQGAFTADRVKVIKLLASQASISIENARIYESQEKLLKAQQRFVPGQFLKHLGHNDITTVELGESVSMEMSVLFTDIRNFTSFAEQQPPAIVIQFLNRLYDRLGTSIRNSHGFIDSYAGDGVMALFAVPPIHAVKAGIFMSQALDKFNKNSKKKGMPEVQLGIGINTGPLILGTMGGEKRMQCSVLGDTVNLASRIEHLTRFYDAQLLIGEQTYNLSKNPNLFSVRMVDYVAVKGKTGAIKLYEVLNAEDKQRRAKKETTKTFLTSGMEAYYSRNFTAAIDFFNKGKLYDPYDKVFDIFLMRAKKHVKNPPPQNWGGYENLDKK